MKLNTPAHLCGEMKVIGNGTLQDFLAKLASEPSDRASKPVSAIAGPRTFLPEDTLWPAL